MKKFILVLLFLSHSLTGLGQEKEEIILKLLKESKRCEVISSECVSTLWEKTKAHESLYRSVRRKKSFLSADLLFRSMLYLNIASSQSALFANSELLKQSEYEGDKEDLVRLKNTELIRQSEYYEEELKKNELELKKLGKIEGMNSFEFESGFFEYVNFVTNTSGISELEKIDLIESMMLETVLTYLENKLFNDRSHGVIVSSLIVLKITSERRRLPSERLKALDEKMKRVLDKFL